MPEMDGLAVARAIKADPSIRAVRLLILSSVNDDGHHEVVEQLGLGGWLTKPVRQSVLRATLLGAVQSEVSPSPGEAYRPDRRPTPRAMSSQRILLAEDNPVNREVALEMLELLGDQVDAVENGRETVAASAGVSYDLILMDCQMPKMDGFAVVAAIRQWEAVQNESRRVPIIALTALAQMSDRARCLARRHGRLHEQAVYAATTWRQDSATGAICQWRKGNGF